MQNKKRNVIISLSLILMLLVAVGSFKASANEVNLKSEIKDFSLVNSGTGYTNKKTTSFFQEENGFDANVIDKEDNNVVATGDLLTYNVTATIANGLKRQVDFSFVIPKELQLNAGTNNDVDKYAKAFCGADDPYDNLVEYGPREATYTNNVLKCSYFVKSSVSFDPLRKAKLDLRAINKEGKVVDVDHVVAKVSESNKKGENTTKINSDKIKIVSAPAFDVKIGTPELTKSSEIGIHTVSNKDETTGDVTRKIKKLELPKGGSFFVEPYNVKYSEYDLNKGYADITEWSAVVQFSGANFPAGTKFYLNNEEVDLNNNSITIPKTNATKVEIKFVLPYEDKFKELYGEDAFKESRLNEIGTDKINQFFQDEIFEGKSNYDDQGRYIGGAVDLDFNAKVIVDKDAFKTPGFENLNGLALPGSGDDEDHNFNTANYDKNGSTINSVKGTNGFANNKYNGLTFHRAEDKELESNGNSGNPAPPAPPCTEDPEQQKCTPAGILTADKNLYRPWNDLSTNFEEDRIKYDDIKDETENGALATGGGNKLRVVANNDFKTSLMLKSNTYYDERKVIKDSENSLVLMDKFDYNDVKVVGYAQNVKYPAEYKKHICLDNEECTPEVIVQIGLDKNEKNINDNVNDSSWITIGKDFDATKWDDLIKKHKSTDDKKIAVVRVIYPNAFYQTSINNEDVNFKGTALIGNHKSNNNIYSVYIPMRVNDIKANPSGSVCTVKPGANTINDKICSDYYANISVKNAQSGNIFSEFPINRELTFINSVIADTNFDVSIKGPNNSSPAKITQRDNTNIHVSVNPTLSNVMYLVDEYKPTIDLTVDACIYDINFKNNDKGKINGRWTLTGERKYRCDQRDEENSQTKLTFTSDYMSMKEGIDTKEFNGVSYTFTPIEFDAKVSALAPQYEELKTDGEFKIDSFKLLSNNYETEENVKYLDEANKVENPKHITDKFKSVFATINFSSFSYNGLEVLTPFVEKNQPVKYEATIMTNDKARELPDGKANNIIVLPGKGPDLTYAQSLDIDFLLEPNPKSSTYDGSYKLNNVSFIKEDSSAYATVYCTTDKLDPVKLSYDDYYKNLTWYEMAKVGDKIDSDGYSWSYDKADAKTKNCGEHATALKIEQPTVNKKDDVLNDLSKLEIELLPENNEAGNNYLMWLSKNQLVSDINEPADKLAKMGINTRNDVEGQEKSTYPFPENAEVVARNLSGHVYWAKSEESPEWDSSSRGWSDKDIKINLYQVDENNKRLSSTPFKTTTVDEQGNYIFRELPAGHYQVEIKYPKKTTVLDREADVKNVYRAYSTGGLTEDCDDNTCKIITDANKLFLKEELGNDLIIDDVDFGFVANRPIVDIMKQPAKAECLNDKNECTIEWQILAKNDGVNQLNEVEIVDTMSSEVELVSAKYQKIGTYLNDNPITEFGEPNTEHNAKGYVKRTFTFSDGFEFNPNDKVLIEVSGKVKRSDKAFNIGNQVYINSYETTKDGKTAEPTFDLTTLPEVEKFNPLVAGKWEGNDTCTATEDWANIGEGDQCDQVYAGIPEAGNVGYLEGNVWDTGYEDRNRHEDTDKDVRLAGVELYKVKASTESEESNDDNTTNLEFVESKMTDKNGYYFFDNVNPEDEYAVKVSYGLNRDGRGYYYAFVDPARGKLCPGEGISCAVPTDEIVENFQTRDSKDTAGSRQHEAINGAYINHLKVQPFTLTKNINAAIYQNKTIVETANPSLTDNPDCDKAPEVILPELEGIEWTTKQDKNGSKYVVTAKPAEGYVIKEGQQTTWELTYKINPCPIPTMPTTGNQSLFYVLMVGLIGTIGLTTKIVLNNRKY